MRSLTSLPHVPDAPPAHVCADVDATLAGFTLDDAGSRPDAHVGHLPQAHVTAAGNVDQQPANVASGCGARRGSARTTTSNTFSSSKTLPT